MDVAGLHVVAFARMMLNCAVLALGAGPLTHSRESAASAASPAASWTTSGTSNSCTVGVGPSSGSASLSRRARSWATCWTTIHAARGSSARI